MRIRKHVSRILAVLLCLTFLVGLVPTALAEGELTISGNGTVEVGSQITLNALESVTWSSSPTSVATVDTNGVVTGVSAGTATITATATSDGRTATKDISVTAPLPANIPVIGVGLNKTSLTLVRGASETLTATITPSDATDKALTWSSSAPSIANVSSAGVVTASSTVDGPAVITVTTHDGSHTASCNVTVVPPAPTISSTASTITVKRTATLTVNNLPNGATVAWSSNTSGATLSPATGTSTTVTGVSPVDAVITAVVTPSGGGTATNLTYAIKVQTATASAINLTMKAGGVLTFDPADFNSKSIDVYGRNLNYVKFTQPSTSVGTLYYDYVNSSSSKISESREYARSTSGTYPLNRVSFVPASGYEGTASISYSAVDVDGNSFTGTVRITVEEESTTIPYYIEKDKVLTFSSTDFNTLCRSETGSNLSYVKFSLPSTSKGVLYFNYTDSSTYGSSVSSSTKYYRSSSPELDMVSFVPKSGYVGTVEIEFTGVSTGNDSFSGTVSISVGKGAGDVNYTATPGAQINFDASDFNTFCKDETGSSLSYVKFTLPSSSKGVLYYDYTSSTRYDSKVSASTAYYRGDTPELDEVTFVPAASKAEVITISFTGKSAGGHSISGTVALTYNAQAATTASTISYSSNGQPVTFSKSDFTAACDGRGGAQLSSVKFSLPSTAIGTLYYSYTSATTYGGLVSPSTAYDPGTSSSSLSNVTFVPAPGYNGTAVIDYTGTDKNGETYTGKVSITVFQPTPQFTDMSNYTWAQTAVNYLYQRGIVKGTTDTTFGPGNYLSRGDFVLMLVRAFNLSGTPVETFKDVPSGAYYAAAVNAAKHLGIAQGEGGYFRPEDSLTRQDAMVLIQRTLAVKGKSLSVSTNKTLASFGDGASVSDYAKDAVTLLLAAGAVSGDDFGNLNPHNPLTRAEMAVILYRVLTK